MASNCSAWMESQEGQSPYTTAQLVGQLCNSGYTVSSTNFQENQYIPNNTTANACTCSWASYNLLSACAVCAGQVQLTSWSTWIANCGSFVSSTTCWQVPSVHSSGR
ncbi:hypothetical protein BS17DRAFT_271942 [Gyrodon lividus]|nr:hypothetical protein BS17DRAFT_271942 [Gyrodon lividus]